jgi:hypothetical protein
MLKPSERSSAWRERYVRDVEVAGSNPVAPTEYQDHFKLRTLSLYFSRLRVPFLEDPQKVLFVKRVSRALIISINNKQVFTFSGNSAQRISRIILRKFFSSV